ncbi:MAG: UDP-N-acetylmuramoyl-tripeptide--D-alanyl-D-alanine ligase [Firmicutes bacterium]|nr:UDP-N-acetylmuramoyl-tripeptide--D-alanyl-D-alanine ligase [Bacillota bacterium]
MKKFTISEIASAINGNIVQGDAGQTVDNVSIDSRSIQPGDLFFALVGENHDGHRYVSNAVEAGARALVLSQTLSDSPNNIPVIMVDDTLEALQQLARYNRIQFEIPVIGITGSNGKTTTKDLVSAVLSKKYRVLKTKGNFNNEIGLPLTLLQLSEEYNAAVVEMGMRGLGQIDQLCSISRINAGIITNIGETHLEILGSVDNIAKAKGEILKHIPTSGFALIPANSKLAQEQARHCSGSVISFGENCQGDFTATNISLSDQGSSFTVCTPVGEMEMVLPIPGRHNISNAMAAVAVGVELGMTLQQCADGLKDVEISAMRLQVLNIDQLLIINDSYNANPDSTRAALTTLKDLAGKRRRVAVLGSMFELGDREQKGHYETGETAADVDLLVAVGKLAREIVRGAKDTGMPSDRVHWFADNHSAANYLKHNLKPEDVILVKGSRGMKMEEIVEYIKESGVRSQESE